MLSELASWLFGIGKEGANVWMGVQAKVKKNVETDTVGDKIGRIHLGRQDLSELQTRKMKGLKRSRDLVEEEEQRNGDVDVEMMEEEISQDEDEDEFDDLGDYVGDGEDEEEGGVEVKRPRLE